MEALCATLHIWTQIVGKVRFALSPYVTPLVAYAALWWPRAVLWRRPSWSGKRCCNDM